ncbi:alpha-D-ribose 1-methylphosphonate 5-triphosphate diphosphatase [Lutimaribacter marinistellae]|uniref:Alpha-D-ribose 1-methylphosphonate 5-triphosphate diphosphatase n=1 Tax=Lutimaribacter marinistellae TaxID=1820329 RepID=A0ABV7TFE5_9RHOB
MSALELTFTGAEVLLPGKGLVDAPLSIARGQVTDETYREVNLSGFLVLPGIVDLHGDGFEPHVAPRRGVMKATEEGLIATEAEIAANGITTAVLAQFYSWEGGLRGPEFAARVFEALVTMRDEVATDLRGQLRFETHMLDHFEGLKQKLRDWAVEYIVFNDHLPHDRLSQGRKPPRLVGQALKAGRNPEAHFEMLLDLHAKGSEVAAALDTLCTELLEDGVLMGSHDDGTAKTRNYWRERGARISEFPETIEAAEAARSGGDFIVMGAPNLVRGGSHKGNVSALDLVAMGLCDALASDYHYPSPRRAALMLAQTGVLDFEAAWGLVSSGPAGALGLSDRGTLSPGLRADIVVLDKENGRVAGTFAGGRASYLAGDLAARLIG